MIQLNGGLQPDENLIKLLLLLPHLKEEDGSVVDEVCDCSFCLAETRKSLSDDREGEFVGEETRQ